VLAFVVGRVWERFKSADWRIVIQNGLVPVSIGMIAASALVIARAADESWTSIAITGVTAGLAYWTRWNPLWMFAAAGLLGIAGLV
jgi:chromate transporter